jgi:hypothetical protein
MNAFQDVLMVASLCLLLGACGSTATESESTKEILDTIESISISEEVLLEEKKVVKADLMKESESRVRATLFEWAGTIDDKYSIKLEFSIEKGGYQKAREKGGVVELNGWYEYETTKEAMRLYGTWNMETKELVLKRYKEEVVDEIFEGTFVNSFEPIVGNWTKIRNEKKVPFKLKALVDKKEMTLFAQKLGEALNNENAEELNASGAGVDDFGIYLDDLEAWRPSWVMANDYFDGKTAYSSTARGSDYSITVHSEKLPFSEEVIIWESESYVSYEKDDEEGEVEGDNEYDYDRSNIWWYNGQIFIDLLVDTTQRMRVTKLDGFYQVEDKSTKKKWLQSRDNGYLEIVE